MMGEEDEFELTPILGDQKTGDEENGPSQENDKNKLKNTVKGIAGAFLWGFSCAVSEICVQALENRSVKCFQSFSLIEVL